MALWGSSVRSRSAPPAVLVYAKVLHSTFVFTPRGVILKEYIFILCVFGLFR